MSIARCWSTNHLLLCVANLIVISNQAQATNSLSDRPEHYLDAIQQAEVIQQERFADPLAGLVINRSVTVQGHEFYRFFSQQWRVQHGNSPFTLTVVERPSARWGSEIWIDFRRQRIYHAFLPPARASTKKISEQAVETVTQNIKNSELERLLSHNPDLGAEEF